MKKQAFELEQMLNALNTISDVVVRGGVKKVVLLGGGGLQNV